VTLGVPLALLAVPALLAVLAAIVLVRRRREGAGDPFPDTDLVALAAPRLRLRRRAPLVLAGLGAALLGVAAARPALDGGPRPTGHPASVVLALDVSGSMTETDIAPSRLEAAVRAAGEFARRAAPGSRIGLVAFSTSAKLLLAPTEARAPLLESLAHLVPEGSTAIGDAVLTAVSALEERGAARGGNVVVLSDGQNVNGATPQEAAERARHAGVRVDTVALGSGPGAPATTAGGEGGVETLKHLAADTGGRSFRSAEATHLGRLYRSLAADLTGPGPGRELAAPLAAAGAALIVVAALGASLRSRRWRTA
jgi:Ca-activated chloride channel family protein